MTDFMPIGEYLMSLSVLEKEAEVIEQARALFTADLEEAADRILARPFRSGKRREDPRSCTACTLSFLGESRDPWMLSFGANCTYCGPGGSTYVGAAEMEEELRDMHRLKEATK